MFDDILAAGYTLLLMAVGSTMLTVPMAAPLLARWRADRGIPAPA